MLNIESIDTIVLSKANKMTVDAMTRSGSYSESLIGPDGEPISNETRLLKRVYDGPGIADQIDADLDYLTRSRSKSLGPILHWGPEVILTNLMKEVNDREDYNPEKGCKNLYSYVKGKLLENVIKSMKKGRYQDKFLSATDFTTEGDVDIDAGEVSTEFLMYQSGVFNNLFASADEVTMDPIVMSEARIQLVKSLSSIYQIQINLSSKSSENEVQNILRFIQENSAEISIKQGAEEVEKIVGPIPARYKPDERENKNHSAAISRTGKKGTYDSRKSITSLYKLYAEVEDGGIYRASIMQFARACETLRIPIPMINADLVMTSKYVNMLYAAINGVYTANLNEYDLQELELNTDISKVFTLAVKDKVSEIRKKSSKPPQSKMGLFVTPERLEQVRNLKLSEMKMFSAYVVDSAERGIELWKESNKNKDTNNTTNKGKIKSSSKMHLKIRKDLKRSAVIFVLISEDEDLDTGEANIKKGPGHPDTVKHTDKIINDYRLAKFKKEGVEKIQEFNALQSQVIETIKNNSMFKGHVIRIRNRFLYDVTEKEYITIDVKNHPFNIKGKDTIFYDYLIRDDGFLVSNFISYHFDGTKTTPVYAKKEDFSGLTILDVEGKLIHKE